MNLGSTSLGDITLVVTAIAAGFLAALWLSLIIWTFRDIRKRARDPLTRILAMLIVLILFLPGFLIYLILRPSSTLEDEYQRTLEEEALLQNIEDAALCPGCNRRIQSDWMVCPSCHTLLKKRCPNCSRLMDLPWNLCPYCATTVPGVRLENVVSADAFPDLPVDESAPQGDSDEAEGSDAEWIMIPHSGEEKSQPDTPLPEA